MIDGLERAVAAGVIDRPTAQKLEPYLAAPGAAADSADPDDEKLRLVTGFNDIFVTIGLLMFLGALYFLLSRVGFAAAFAVAAASWALAEFFTARRRMALPSIVLLVIFVGAVFSGMLGLLQAGHRGDFADLAPSDVTSVQMLLAAAAAAVAAFLHWQRFHVPITVAAGVGAVAGIVLALCQIEVPDLLADHPVAVFLPLGLAIFALAMWFDSSDLTRQTRRTDIAFWLHLLAAPIIVHPILLSVTSTAAPTAAAAQVIAVFLCLAAVALVVDRRAILVSSLSYLAYAAGKLIAAAGLESSSFAASTLAVGAVVLMLSAAWRPLRRTVMGLLPTGLRARLPAVT
ncbi:hypothetical protein DK847_13595 [Aestuariivirga litoralis]|uniref:DUF2157 domain-containing protein n=1 Tax=Aestuariivirga litoralis TaxID=2650924 RepID=A0A2W2ALH8_9HYPH|nr:hypothetical protein [Aestuariivirga litoralis]PZF76231.1 hypothetical protein DK847_13595 [Aestuariivirga litoralis]